MLLTPNCMCSYVSPFLTEASLRDAAEQASKRQNEGVLEQFVEAAKRAAKEEGVAIADAYAIWKKLKAVGVDTTAMLKNWINHPEPEAHRIFVNAIMETLFK